MTGNDEFSRLLLFMLVVGVAFMLALYVFWVGLHL